MDQASNYTEEIPGKLDWKTGFIQQAGSSLVLSLAGWSKAGGQWDQWSSDSTKKTARNLVCRRNCRDATCVTMFFCFFIHEIGWKIQGIGWKIQEIGWNIHEIGWDNCETRQLKDATGWNFRVLNRFIQEMGWLIWRIGCFIWAVGQLLYAIWRNLCTMCWFNWGNCGFNQEMPLRFQLSFEGLGFIKMNLWATRRLNKRSNIGKKDKRPHPITTSEKSCICSNKHLWKKAFVETNKHPHPITTSEKSRICRRWSSSRNWTIGSLHRAFPKNKVTGKM